MASTASTGSSGSIEPARLPLRRTVRAWQTGAGASARRVILRHTLQEPPPRPAVPERKHSGPAAGERLAVRVLDNPVNTYQQVMDVCSQALGISFEAAFDIARAIDTAGSCIVCIAPRLEAERIAVQIAAIGIEVRLEQVDGPATVC
jgi:ATP-dependent Clp protease adapter protein ClpS